MSTIKKITTTFLVVFVTIVFSLSAKADVVEAVLQYKIDVTNPPNIISAITTYDQKLSTGQSIPKGTRFLGKINKEEAGIIISFDLIKNTVGSENKVTAQSVIADSEVVNHSGISGELGDAMREKTKSSVLGAIFHSNSTTAENSYIPRGTKLKIKIN